MDVIHDYGYINRDIATDEYVEQVGNEAYWDNPTFKSLSTETTEKKYDDEPIFIEVVERKKDAEESENWADNFEVTEVHRIDPVSSKVS